MLGTGGSALVAAQLGAEKHRCALQNFSLLVAGCVVLSTLLAVLGLLYGLGADDVLYPFCAAYAGPLFLATPFTMAGLILDIFLVTAG